MTIDNLCQKYAMLDERGKDVVDHQIAVQMRYTLKGKLHLAYETALKQDIQNGRKEVCRMNRRCDFDPPETPVERLIRGLKIALDGAKALDELKRWTEPIQELLSCVQETAQSEETK